MLELTDILAAQPPGSRSCASSNIQGLRPSSALPVMPFVTPYEMLTMRVTAQGVGKNLRYGIVM